MCNGPVRARRTVRPPKDIADEADGAHGCHGARDDGRGRCRKRAAVDGRAAGAISVRLRAGAGPSRTRRRGLRLQQPPVANHQRPIAGRQRRREWDGDRVLVGLGPGQCECGRPRLFLRAPLVARGRISPQRSVVRQSRTRRAAPRGAVTRRRLESERRVRPPEWLLPMSFALAYFAGAELSQLLSVKPGNFATLWPPSGLYVAALLVTPPRQWPQFMVAAALANSASDAFHGRTMWVSASFWLANTLEAGTAAWLLRSLFPSPFRLDRLKSVLGLAWVCGLVSVPVGAVLGALTLRSAFGTPFADAWLACWIADVVGIIVFAPLVLAFKDGWEVPPVWPSLWRMIEAGLFLVTTALVVAVVFGVVPGRPVKFALYPCLLWGAVRFGLRGASSGLALATVLAVSFTLSEWGAFSSADLPPLSGMHVVQLFLGVTAVSFLALAAVIVERDDGSRELGRLYDKVRQSEKELRDAIDTIPTGVGAALPDGSMEFVNRRWADYAGMEDSSGSRWQAGVHP